MRPELVKQAIRASFDRGANEYDTATADTSALLRNIFEPVSNKASCQVLDIGCGTGLSAFVFHQLQPTSSIIGLDISYSMVALAQSKSRASGYPDIFWLQGDAEQLPFAAETFDVVISSATFQWLPDKKKVLTEVYRVLRIGGTIALVFVGWKPSNYVSIAYERVVGHSLNTPLEDIWNREQLVALVAETQFHQLAVSDFPLPNQFPLDDEDKKFLRVIVGWWQEGLDEVTIAAIERKFDEVIEEQLKCGEEPLESWAVVGYFSKVHP